MGDLVVTPALSLEKLRFEGANRILGSARSNGAASGGVLFAIQSESESPLGTEPEETSTFKWVVDILRDRLFKSRTVSVSYLPKSRQAEF